MIFSSGNDNLENEEGDTLNDDDTPDEYKGEFYLTLEEKNELVLDLEKNSD